MDDPWRSLAAPNGAGFDGQICSPYDSQIPSTSSINTGPNTPQRCNTPVSQQSPFRQTVMSNSSSSGFPAPPQLASDKDRLAQLRESQANRMAHTQAWMMENEWRAGGGGGAAMRGPSSAVGMNGAEYGGHSHGPQFNQYRQHTPSVISRLSHVTGNSSAGSACYSPLPSYASSTNCCSELSVNTQLSNDYAMYGPAYVHQMNALSLSSATSSVENQRPAESINKFCNPDATVEKFTMELESDHLTLDQKMCTIREIERQMNARSGNRTIFDIAHREKLKRLIFQLFRQVVLDYNHEAIKHIFAILVYFVNKAQKSPQMSEIIYEIHKECIRSGNHTGLISVLLNRLKLGHTIFTDKCLWILCAMLNLNRIYRKAAREQCGLIEILLQHYISKESTVSERPFVADCIRLIIKVKEHSKQLNSLKQRIVANNGIEIFLRNIEFNEDEKLLYATAYCLYELIKDSPYVDRFIEAGGIQKMGNLMSHGSNRLLYQILYCMTQASQRSTVVNQDITDAIISTIRMIGANDPEINHEATRFLMNVSYASMRNRMTIVKNNGVPTVLMFLPTLENFFIPSETRPYNIFDMRAKVSETQRHILSLLMNLSRPHPEYPDEWVRETLKVINQHCHISCKFFFAMIACSNKIEFYYPAAYLIKRCLEFNAGYAVYFLDITDKQGVMLPTRLLQRTKLVLEEIRAMRNNLAGGQEKSLNENVIKMRIHDSTDFIITSFQILLYLGRHQRFAEKLTLLLRESNPLTLLNLELTNDLAMWERILSFAHYFCRHSPNHTIWLHDPLSRSCLNHVISICEQHAPNLAKVAHDILGFLNAQRAQQQTQEVDMTTVIKDDSMDN